MKPQLVNYVKGVMEGWTACFFRDMVVCSNGKDTPRWLWISHISVTRFQDWPEMGDGNPLMPLSGSRLYSAHPVSEEEYESLKKGDAFRGGIVVDAAEDYREHDEPPRPEMGDGFYTHEYLIITVYEVP